MYNWQLGRTFYNLIVPEYLLITIGSSYLAAITISKSFIFSAPLLASIVAYSVAMIAFNVFNMIVDRDLDKINKPARPIPAQAVSVQTAKQITLILYLIACVFAYFATPEFQLLFLAYLAACALYTSPITYAKRHHIATPLFGAIFYGAMPYLTAYSSSGNNFQPEVFAMYIIAIAAISSLKDIEDTRGEKLLGHNSIAISHSQPTVLKIAGLGLVLSLLPIAATQIFLRKNVSFALPLILGALISSVFYFKLEKKQFLVEHTITQSGLVTVGMAMALWLELLIAISYLGLD